MTTNRVAPNTLVPRDPNPRERGLGPVNSKRWRGASRLANGTGVEKRPVVRRERRPTGRSSGPELPRFARKRAPRESSAAQLPFR
jgi:hypothetical protein